MKKRVGGGQWRWRAGTLTAASLAPSPRVKCGLISSLIKLLWSEERVGPEVVHTDSLVN